MWAARVGTGRPAGGFCSGSGRVLAILFFSFRDWGVEMFRDVPKLIQSAGSQVEPPGMSPLFLIS